MRIGQLVVVKEGDPISTGLGNAAIAGDGNPWRQLFDVADQPAGTIAHLCDDLPRAIRRGVVHHEHFIVEYAAGLLRQKAYQGQFQGGGAVVGANHDRNQWTCHALKLPDGTSP